MILYERPQNWMRYELQAILPELTGAKAALISLTAMPYQKSWAEKLQAVKSKRGIAGTLRMEGADFTERELDAALQESPRNFLPVPNVRLPLLSPRIVGWLNDPMPGLLTRI